MIAIIKYNAGNVASVKNAIERLGYDCIITDDSELIRSANKVILPGVGEAGTAMAFLKSKGLDKLIVSLTQPVLGICLGQQLMCNSSEEGDAEGLGIFNSKVRRFPADDKVPHVGWNSLEQRNSELFRSMGDSDDFYFVHSYYCELCPETVATCNYILPFSAAMQIRNFYATQFHPEKSSSAGEQLLKNFLAL